MIYEAYMRVYIQNIIIIYNKIYKIYYMVYGSHMYDV